MKEAEMLSSEPTHRPARVIPPAPPPEDLAGPYVTRGRCVQRLCWGGTAIDAAPEGDVWHADVYAPGKWEEPAREVWAASWTECWRKADRAAVALGWTLAAGGG